MAPADLHNASDAYLMHGISNGDTKFVFGANGNVGIGTTLPKAKRTLMEQLLSEVPFMILMVI